MQNKTIFKISAIFLLKSCKSGKNAVFAKKYTIKWTNLFLGLCGRGSFVMMQRSIKYDILLIGIIINKVFLIMNWFVKNKIKFCFITDKTGVVVTNKQSIMMYIQFIAEKK